MLPALWTFEYPQNLTYPFLDHLHVCGSPILVLVLMLFMMILDGGACEAIFDKQGVSVNKFHT